MGLEFSSQAEEGKSLGIQGNVGKRLERQNQNHKTRGKKERIRRVWKAPDWLERNLKNKDSTYIFVGWLIWMKSGRDRMETKGIEPGFSEGGQRKQNQLLRTVCAGSLGR
jgi:hypothetical protein